MTPSQIIDEAKHKIEASTARLQEELKKLHTGRAHPSLLDGVMVDAYGQPMPLRAVASIAVPEATLLQITPFDIDNLQAVANAIRDDKTLGLTPTDDGRVVRINLPPMTSENRQQMVKNLHQKVEDCFVSVRQARHEAFHKLEQAEKAKAIGLDERERSKKQIDDIVAHQKTQVDSLTKTKEQEILTI